MTVDDLREDASEDRLWDACQPCIDVGGREAIFVAGQYQDGFDLRVVRHGLQLVNKGLGRSSAFQLYQHRQFP